MHRALLLMSLCCAPLLAGCYADAEPASQVGEAREDRVIHAELGGSYDFEVRRAGGEEVTSDHAKLLLFHVEAGQTFAAVMRQREADAMDAYLALYPPNETEKVAVSDWQQASVPMAFADDAVIIHTASKSGDFALMAADHDLDADASFQLDLVLLDVAPTSLDLTLTNPTVRAMQAELREDDGLIGEWLGSGRLSEGADGLLEVHLHGVPLKERAKTNGLTARVNDLRTTLYEAFVRANSDSDDAPADAELTGAVGITLTTLWSELRTDDHLLR